MRRLILILGLGMAVGAVGAPSETQMVSVNSTSGQFIAYERQSLILREASLPEAPLVPGSQAFVLRPHLSPEATNLDRLMLEPAVLVVSSERVKEELLKALGMTDAWRSQIDLLIDRAMADDAMPKLTAQRGRAGWAYKLDLPKAIAPRSLIRALVGAMLVEIANRDTGTRSAPVPLWLLEGMSAHLEANNLPMLTPEPGTGAANDHFALDGQRSIRALVRDRLPCTFRQLSEADKLDTEADKEFFRVSSQLLVEELLNLRNGGAKLRTMLSQAGVDGNWQTAFLAAFHEDFASLTDVEKWWAVAGVDFRSEDSGAFASTPEVWRRLQETLDVPVEVKLGAGRAPTEARITLQEAIMKWNPEDAAGMMRRTMVRLEVLRYRSTEELRPVIDGYIAALGTYLKSKATSESGSPKQRTASTGPTMAQSAVCRRLDELDAKRDEMRITMQMARNQRPPAPARISSSTKR